MRVGLVLRSTEIKPLFPRFVHLYGLNPPPVVRWLLGLRWRGLDDGGTVRQVAATSRVGDALLSAARLSNKPPKGLVRLASLLFCFALLQQQWLLKSFPSLAALLCFACSVIVTYLPSPAGAPRRNPCKSAGRRRRARARDRGACFLLAGGMYVCLCVRRCALRPLLCESVQVGKHAPRSPAGAGAGGGGGIEYIYHSPAPQP